MKTFKEYLSESKKVYQFKVKVAGDLPENFDADLKSRLECCKVVTFEKLETTPVQKVPLDFPNLSNKEVHIYNVVLEYPITSPEIAVHVKETGLTEECFRVRGAGEPAEAEQIFFQEEPSGKAMLEEPTMEVGKIKHKDYFGDEFNKGFLKDLDKAAKARRKELGQDKGKPDVLGSAPKIKQDKAGNKSAVGS